jgi:hypothetical protein
MPCPPAQRTHTCTAAHTQVGKMHLKGVPGITVDHTFRKGGR